MPPTEKVDGSCYWSEGELALLAVSFIDLFLSVDKIFRGSNPRKEDGFMATILNAVIAVHSCWVFRAGLLLLGMGLALPQPNNNSL